MKRICRFSKNLGILCFNRIATKFLFTVMLYTSNQREIGPVGRVQGLSLANEKFGNLIISNGLRPG